MGNAHALEQLCSVHTVRECCDSPGSAGQPYSADLPRTVRQLQAELKDQQEALARSRHEVQRQLDELKADVRRDAAGEKPNGLALDAAADELNIYQGIPAARSLGVASPTPSPKAEARVSGWFGEVADKRQGISGFEADHDARILLTSDGLSNNYLIQAFLGLFATRSIPKDRKALVLMDSSIFRDPSKKAESFKDQLLSFGWPEENIDCVNLIDKAFIPAEAKDRYNGMVAEAKLLYDRLNAGEKLKGDDPGPVAKMREESLRLNREHSKALEEYLLHLETYDVILGNGGDVVIANFALKINPQVLGKIKSLIRSGKTAYVGRSAGSMVASKTMRLSGEVTDDFMQAFLGGDPKGELQVFGAPIAFRPHYDDKTWGQKVHDENVDTTDEDGCVFVPVKNGEGIIMQVDRKGKEDFRAVIRQNTIIDEMEHVLNYLPRADISPMVLDRQKYIEDYEADHKARILLTSDGLSNEFLVGAFLDLFDEGLTEMPKMKKHALVLTDSSAFRDPSKKAESFKDQLISLGWPERNIATLNLLDKKFIPIHAKGRYTMLIAEAKKLYDLLMSGEDFGEEEHPIVEKLREESLRLNAEFPDALEEFMAELETYDVIMGNGGDVCISNFALKINPQVAAKIKQLVRSGRTAYVGRSAGSMVASKTMRLSGEVTPGFLKSFLGGDPKGELQVFKAPIAFRPHYDDKAWGTKVKAENEDTSDEDGVVFVPVKNGEGIIMEVNRQGKEAFRAVIRQNTIIDEMEHVLNYLPRYKEDDD
jgi:cyanophycinase-like exopeptidase